MSIWSELGEFGNDILEAGGDIVGGFGQNYSNQADYQAALIERIRVNNQLAAQQYMDDARRKDELQSFIKTVTIALILVIIVIYIIRNLPKK